MRKEAFFRISILGFALILSHSAHGQSSGREYTRSAIMNGNRVSTVFGNWGIIGQPAAQGNRGSWKNPNDGYLGDVSPLVGAEVRINGGVVFHSVVTCPFYPTQRPAANQDVDPKTNEFWTFEPVEGYFNANQDKVALSNNPASWPPTWPDKMSDATDPGWAGRWDGYGGAKTNADLETYFVMDDGNDKRFNDKNNNKITGSGIAFHPDSTNLSRNGLGLEVRVRALQWNDPLAQDNIFWLYEITNKGTTPYYKTVFGMLVGTYVGCTADKDFGQEYSDDFSFYDVYNNITYTGDFKAINGRKMNNPFWVGGTGLVGYAFLESPGNPFDGIDNDGDADSSSLGLGAPKFTESDFAPRLVTPGMTLVSIDDEYQRHTFTVSSADSMKVWTRGMEDSIWIYPGRTRLAEGNLVTVFNGTDSVQAVNPNALDGIDNNFNGLIDENYFIHYQQIKQTRDNPPVVLLRQLRPLRHIDYVTGAGTSPYSMIDERRDDDIDNNLDWNLTYDDVGRDGVPSTHDYGEGDGLPTSGYDAQGHDTGLPGEPHVDKTDPRESDQIGLTSFFYFTPSSDVQLGNDEYLWTNLAPGFFDVPKSIVNNRPVSGQDGDFFYGSGYFPLLPQKTERFTLALVYGGGNGGGLDADLADLLKNKKTVQKIYDANYAFPIAPDPPTLTAVPGDHQVTLYWDRKSENWVDPVLHAKTFEGYKLYKSTDPTFNDIYTLTDGRGVPRGETAARRWDLIDGITGYFPETGELLSTLEAFPFFLGNDSTGVPHSYVDRNVDNGRTYYYALVAYTRGDPVLGIYPKENSNKINISTAGVVSHGVNIAVVVPNAPVAGYTPAADAIALSPVAKIATGSAFYRVVDPRAITGHPYKVDFIDSEIDSLDIYGNIVRYTPDSTKWDRKTTSYSVQDLTDFTENFASRDTAIVQFKRQNLIPSTVVVQSGDGSTVPSSKYILNYTLGNIRGTTIGDLPSGNYRITYQYYPVFRSPNIQGNPFLADSVTDGDNFDGVRLVFQNDWGVRLNDTLSHWVGMNPYTYSFAPLNVEFSHVPYVGYRKPADYRITFSDAIVDTSYYDEVLSPISIPVNFRIYDETDSTYIKFIFADGDGNGILTANDELVFVEKDPLGKYHYTWDMLFTAKQGEPSDTVYHIAAGTQLLLRTSKPFRYGDAFQFTPTPPSVDSKVAANSLDRIRVVPNPYLTASEFEPPLPPGVTSGRGTRKIDFIHLPAQSTIKIFTSRGDHVITLRHDSGIDDGTVSWNLKTKENLDIAFGVYFYVVESPVGNKTGKIAIIK